MWHARRGLMAVMCSLSSSSELPSLGFMQQRPRFMSPQKTELPSCDQIALNGLIQRPVWLLCLKWRSCNHSDSFWHHVRKLSS